MALTPSPVRDATLRIPPQDVEAERALLGSLMVRTERLYEIVDTIKKESFYVPKHQIIFEAMSRLMSSNEPLDLVSLTSYLRDHKLLESVGGAAYLAELTAAVPTSANSAYYADLVHKKYVHRSIIAAGQELHELGYAEHEQLDSLIDRAGKVLYDVTNFARRSFINLSALLHDAWERFDQLHKSDQTLRGVPTGFPDLDNKLAGFQRSDLIILAARPSMGKTALALDIARHTALRHGTAVGIFSLEMSSQQLVDRMIAAEARVDSWKLRTGRIHSDEEFQSIRDALDVLSRAPIFIDDEPSNSIMRMKAVARRMKAEHELGLIIVDYLQLMVPRTNSDSLVQQVTEISRSLKALARELEIPVLALSQLNRSVEQRGGKPRLSDLRDSGSIEQDADVVLFIHRQEREDGQGRDNVANIMIEKHRNGPTGHIELFFDADKVSFSPLAKADFGTF